MKIRNKFLRSLRFRIILILVIVGIVPCVILKATILNNYEKRAAAVKISEIQNQCTILCNQLTSTGYLSDPSSAVINAELTQFTNIYNGRILIVDDRFQIIQDTYGVDKGKTLASEDVIRCFRGSGTNHYDIENRYIEVTSPILSQKEKKVSGVMLVSIATDSIIDNARILEEKANIVQATVIIVVLLAAFSAAALLVRPFGRITRKIEGITEGYDVTQELHENAYTETRQISEAFNQMLGRLTAVDSSRQEFVSNVSHELKTPLTSMKVLADSLLAQEDVPAELYKEFMGDIAEEIERENKIINDLLSLVKMDKTAAGLNIKPENINELVERILKRLRPIAAKQNIELVFESFRPVTAEVDEVKLTLAISNLVENAIKYNKEEGYVHVSLNADHKYFYLKVADSGIGIPEEAQRHIFERFYRVDKSHSREIGGTGLGLSIARNAVVMHRGAIKVHSKEGEGTTFTVRIPLTYIIQGKKGETL
ncbi:MAG TPA: two-component sensor histidine kinase [Lachnospiraceae bacterium]|nr:two-component sensor histidine kinase [Lachnospiraceae bacterium]